MKKQIPVILLAVTGTALAFGLYSSNEKNKHLQSEIARAKAPVIDVAPEQNPIPAAEPAATQPEPTLQTLEVAPQAVETTEEPSATAHRMMSSVSKMMDNPTMNKVMAASQRGAVGALYADLIEYLNLNSEETTYFMDLLMTRQMKQVDMAMKMMGGNLSEDEKRALAEEVKLTSGTVKAEMEKFLNNPADVAEWEFYEKTMGERMMLSQMDQKLAGSGAALADGTYRQLLGMMHDERENFTFTSNLSDDKNMDMSAQRFSQENLQNHFNDQEQLSAAILAKAETMLTPEQYAAFADSLKTTAEMQKAQLEMAAQLFGGKGK
ncbi:MAG: hypothetical protein K9M54_05930 [Kiritimatiellales bacterium]|nr:hypothetical protein [Kiritimatiellales bacterium]MCF7864703.1 hypothetical protein [Kiritimatiellales bacterium]